MIAAARVVAVRVGIVGRQADHKSMQAKLLRDVILAHVTERPRPRRTNYHARTGLELTVSTWAISGGCLST